MLKYNEVALEALLEGYQNSLVAYKNTLLQLSKSAHSVSCKDIAQIRDIAHRLKGSGKAYGFPKVSYAANNLEIACEELEQKFSLSSQQQLSETLLVEPLKQLINELESAASAKVSDSGTEACITQHAQRTIKKNEMTLLIIDDDNEFSAMLSKDLAQFGYQTHFLANISQLAEAIEHYRPDGILVDMEFYGERLAGAEQVGHWQERSGYPLPVIFISAHDSFDVRLAAVKAGGHHFLNKPVNLPRLTALLRKELGITEEESPFRILLVDDDQDLLKLYESILRQDGYAVFTASSAEQALEMLSEASPELLLVDVFMPKCSGIELGHLIRQHEKHSDIAMLFMSGEADTDIQLACARLAGDEFISKPIEPWRLRMVIKARVSRTRRRTEAKLLNSGENSHSFDPLTALPMRNLLKQNLETLLGQSKQTVNASRALLKLDIRNFHTFNNLYGPFKGDELLQAVAWRLSETIKGKGSVYRAGGDEFYVLLVSSNIAIDVDQTIHDIVNKLSERYELASEQYISISVDIGIVTFASRINTADELMAHAETALFEAKSYSTPAVTYFDERMSVIEQERFTTAQALEGAILNKDFQAFYQPVFSVQSKRLVGFEALARWQHPTRGLLGPADFIGVLENMGLIMPLTGLMLEQALARLADWHKKDPELFMAVNLSARDIESPSFLKVIASLLKRYNLPPQKVVVEITETTLLSNWQQASHVIDSIKELGVRLALDDFGTGYSSLNYLNRINAEKLKIDRSFIQGWASNGDVRLLSTMVQLGQAMGMSVVAEGVEQEKELALLKELNCDYYQGFLSAKPMPAEQVETEFLSY